MQSSRRWTLATLVLAALTLAAADARAFSARAIDLKINDLLYNPADHLLYVSVPGNVPERGNTITLIDPATGAFVGSIPVGSQPRALALSQDGGTLYVGLAGAGTVQRVDTKARAVTLDIPLPADEFFGPTFAADIAVMPGQPNTIAVSLGYSGVSPSHAGVAVFDDAVMRPTRTPGHTGSNRIEFGSAADRVYGLNTETTEYGFRRLQIDANGITELSVSPDLISGWPEFEWFNGRIYSNGGRVIDPEAARVLGTFPLTTEDYDRSIAPDTGITYFVARSFSGSGVRLQRFNTSTFALLDQRQIRGAYEPPTGAVRWGSHGLAYFTFDFFSDNGRIWLLDGIDDPPNADLEVTVRESRDPATIGDYLTYTVTLRNLGPDDAAGAQLETYFDGGYDLVYMQSPRGDCTTSAATHICAFGTIAAGDSVTAMFTFQPDHEGVLTLHAAAASGTQDGTPANNQVTEATTITQPPAEADLYVLASPEPNVSTIGEPTTLVVDIGNRGTAPATGARLDTRLEGLRYRVESYDNPGGTCTAGELGSRCELGTIAPGGQAQVRIHVTPLEAGYLYGSFQVSSDSPEATPYDNTASIYLAVTPSPESRVDSLIAHVVAYALRNGPEKTLLRPLEDARAAAAAGDDPGTCAALLDFEDGLGKRVGHALSIPAAYSLLAEAETIRELVGCYAVTAGRHVSPAARTHGTAATPVVEGSAPRSPLLRLGPNPSATASRLSFDLSRAGRAKLSVFDVRGRLVAVLADGAFASGPHEITWQHPGAPGVYFYRFEPEGGAPITTRGVILP